MLESRLGVVDAHLKNIDEQKADNTFCKEKEDSLKKAKFCRDYIRAQLHEGNPGLRWLTGKEFLNLWRVMHYAQESLLEFKAIDDLIQDALHDLWSIENSSMNSNKRFELRQEIKLAVKNLDPSALNYFDRQGYEEAWEEQGGGKSANVLNKYLNIKQTRDYSIPDTQSWKEAIAVLREVRQQIFNFRDTHWTNILHMRDQLIGAFVLTTLSTYILLSLAFLFIDGNLSVVPILKDALTLYVVGATAGLFGRFVGESDRTGLPEDYGLSTIRLIAMPFFSGLAAIAGVLFTGILTANGGTALVWSDVFALSPYNLLITAIFGLTPNLLMQILKKQAETLKLEA